MGGVPRRAAVLKQNCGVSAGWGGWETISSFASRGGERGAFDQMRFASVKGVGVVVIWVRGVGGLVVWKGWFGLCWEDCTGSYFYLFVSKRGFGR